MSLTIRKTAQGEFEHIKADGTVLDGNPNATSLGSFVNFKTRNGAIIAFGVAVSTITVIDVANSTNETFPDATSLFVKLRQLGYFNQGEGTVTGGNNTFAGLSDTIVTSPYVNGQIVVVRNGNLTLEEVPNAFGVSSVNGSTGDVVLTTDQIPEGTTNFYFTDARVNANANVQANSAHRTRQDNPHNVTKEQVGLSNVDNTSDVNKPISTPQETRFQEIENETAIVVNGNYATIANVLADTALNMVVANNANRPVLVLNEDGKVYLYDRTNSAWRLNKATDVVVEDNVANFPAVGDLDTIYKVRGANPLLYNWTGTQYTLYGSSEDGTTRFIDAGNAIQGVAPTALQFPNPSEGDLAIKALTDNKSEYWRYTDATGWDAEGLIDYGSIAFTNGQGVEVAGGQVNLGNGNDVTSNRAINFSGTSSFTFNFLVGSLIGLIQWSVNGLIQLYREGTDSSSYRISKDSISMSNAKNGITTSANFQDGELRLKTENTATPANNSEAVFTENGIQLISPEITPGASDLPLVVDSGTGRVKTGTASSGGVSEVNGTITPTMSATGGTFTPGAVLGNYTKTGRQTYFYIILANIAQTGTATAELKIGGFTAESLTMIDDGATIDISILGGATVTGGNGNNAISNLIAFVDTTDNTLFIGQRDNAMNRTTPPIINFSGTALNNDLIISGVLRTA